jgi:YjbE family integral membrane protein
MELFSPEFFSALLAIIVIDLVLAGDNAIVIALAARNLPEKEKTRAIVWGTVGAIVVRAAMTMGVVWLLKIPGLMLIGGLLLIWIAVRLIAPNESGDDHSPTATTFWGAMKTIVIADAVMGVDNVLAVAGAAHGSFVLVVLGLLISIPIVVWGSRLVLKLIERFPSVIMIGGGVLAFTAAKMVLKEPIVQPWVSLIPAGVYWLIVALTVVLTLWLGVRLKRTRAGGSADTAADTA